MTEAAGEEPSKWDMDSSDGDEEMMTDEQKEHKKQFKEWRKKHYNEFYAVQRARELLKKVGLMTIRMCVFLVECSSMLQQL